MENKERGTLLTVFAILFGLLAISNLLKPFQFFGAQTGFVLFGIRLGGIANMIAGPLFGIFLAAYAAGIWNMRRYALPMSHAYALYVIVNIVMWSMLMPAPDSAGRWAFGIVYMTVAIGVSLTSAVVMTRRKEDLS